MGRAIAMFAGSAAGYLPTPLRLSPRVIGFWREIFRPLYDDYRPELHYMRGPGPAWQRKHGPKPAA